jgi:hypothetical protein
MGRPTTWTAESVATLRQMVEDGRAIKEIAQALNRPRGGVEFKMKTLGLRLKFKWNPEADAIYRTMLAGGATHREIAAALGCSSQASKSRRIYLKLPPSARCNQATLANLQRNTSLARQFRLTEAQENRRAEKMLAKMERIALLTRWEENLKRIA